MKSFKLNNLEYSSLNEKEMKHVIGGTVCGCGCCYAGQGGSSTDDNGAANYAGGLHSPGCEYEPYIVLEEIVINS
ncbi:MAG: TIGR04149 family rSAM-modified RiPP [Bacteroidales bacterium]|jgi:natural product precursor|nr:TIGR04149 family rSAM-modified RiPP [Bacteroidales bacterium]MDD2831895.1 TIGR04149 family rSAM-modified RiPP [Bacteroidales bacterium]MDD5045964.1 TIGR04149 family rSAM-modified RiPP [Bacteroidales bacterium]